jgi:hypothetical protein
MGMLSLSSFHNVYKILDFHYATLQKHLAENID